MILHYRDATGMDLVSIFNLENIHGREKEYAALRATL